MKKLLNTGIKIITLLTALVLFSCDEKDCCVLGEEDGDLLTGTWLLYERGYSPGVGYITEPVSAIPPQILTFRSNGTMTSTVVGSNDFKFYHTEDHPDPEQRIVAFYKHFPGESPDPSTFITSYNFSFEGNNLKLYYRYCFEGCHMELRKID